MISINTKIKDLNTRMLRLQELSDERIMLIDDLHKIDVQIAEAISDDSTKDIGILKSKPDQLTAKDIFAKVFLSNSNKPLTVKELATLAGRIGWKTSSKKYVDSIVNGTLRNASCFKRTGRVMGKSGKSSHTRRWNLKTDFYDDNC